MLRTEVALHVSGLVCRLLYLETASDNVSREIAQMRGDLTQVNEWEQRVDTLSNEVAAVFASVQTEQTTFR